MDAANTASSQPLAAFLLELDRAESALEGYPVDQLLHFVCGEAADQATGRRVVDQCLSSWIAALDSALAAMPSGACDSLQGIEGRQRGARDALAQLRSTLPPTYGDPGHRGPPS